ncbi:NADPH-dependent oxidoreductase [Phyllobacterium salinisoli]|uniref:NADPH-dependent oxidoreductase n=1 Tax=Phyllobacterium salinisoli TaxID=1899321 RepID=A0A368K865_9HYPH|nr:NAD(P)H-dependent oxidoreductase [Phyllobacterium salinisoli]RCS25414.1 NADPH-dependent oxidoreductase [Phyllobacterium salinisoli]
MKPKLHIIICSTRPGRLGPKMAEWFRDFAKEHGKFDAVLVDLAELNLPVFDEPKHPRLKQYENQHTKDWSASVEAADAFVFVTPEYNYSPPPAFFNAVTYLASEWHYKAAAIFSYAGVSGGLRAAQIARLQLSNLKMVAIPEGIAVPSFPQFIDEEGVFKPNDLIAASATTVLGELFRWTTGLQTIRSA